MPIVVGRVLFPCTNFFASSLILLSPKRAMRQLCSLRSHNAQPLETGRHLLAQMDAVFSHSPAAWEKEESPKAYYLFIKLGQANNRFERDN